MQTTQVVEKEHQVVSWGKVVTFGGAVVAFLIGSGFATGQEILQYFASYGYWGVFGTGAVVMVLMVYVTVEFITVGQAKQFPRPAMVYQYFCGKRLGTFFDYFSIMFIFMSFIVMVAGASAVIQQHYNLPKLVGGVTLTVLAAVTVLLGLKRLLAVIGKVGPVIVVIAITVGLSAILRNPGGFSEGNSLLPQLELNQASSNWFLAALSYVGFCMLWLAAFLTAMGRTASSKKEAALGGLTGSVAFSLACLVVAVALLTNIEQVNGTEIPMLILAQSVSGLLADGFAVIVLGGIFTTAVPLLWTVVSRVSADGSSKFRIITVVLAGVGCFIGLLVPFSKIVNVVYVINGYVGVLLLVLMLVKTGTRLVKREAIEPYAPSEAELAENRT